MSPTCGGKDTRSPLRRVSTLLSSSTVFIDSIQSVSTGPSKIIHLCAADSSLHRRLIMEDKTPSCHSRLPSTKPNSSLRSIDFGLRTSNLTCGYFLGFYLKRVFRVFLSIFQHVDLPLIEVPTNILPCRVFLLSYSWTTFFMSSALGTSPAFFI